MAAAMRTRQGKGKEGGFGVLEATGMKAITRETDAD